MRLSDETLRWDSRPSLWDDSRFPRSHRLQMHIKYDLKFITIRKRRSRPIWRQLMAAQSTLNTELSQSRERKSPVFRSKSQTASNFSRQSAGARKKERVGSSESDSEKSWRCCVLLEFRLLLHLRFDLNFHYYYRHRVRSYTVGSVWLCAPLEYPLACWSTHTPHTACAALFRSRSLLLVYCRLWCTPMLVHIRSLSLSLFLSLT